MKRCKFKNQNKKKNIYIYIKADVLFPQMANKVNSFRRKRTGGRNGKERVVRTIQTAGWGGWGGWGRGMPEEGAHLPLSCASWPAVKSGSLPFSAGRPQGAIVPAR